MEILFQFAIASSLIVILKKIYVFVEFCIMQSKAIEIDVRLQKEQKIASQMLESFSQEEFEKFSLSEGKFKIINITKDTNCVRKNLLVIFFGEKNKVVKSFSLQGFFGSQWELISKIDLFSNLKKSLLFKK